MRFSYFSRAFLCFLVFSRILSPHPVVPFCSVAQKATLSQLLTEKHYRVRGKERAFSLFSLFSSCFPVFPPQLQAAPLITLDRRCQKVTFLQKRQLLTLSSQSDEWAGLIWIPEVSFPREKLTISIRQIWCIPFSFSGRKKCVKGGVFFPIQDPVLLSSGSARIRSGQNCRIQAALAYPCCQSCGQLPAGHRHLRKVEI